MSIPGLRDFDEISREMATAKEDCARTYDAWQEATQKLSRLEHERRQVFLGMLDPLTKG